MDDRTKMQPEPRFLSREEILSKTKLRTNIISVPEWGGDVMIRELSGSDRDYYEGEMVTVKVGKDPEMTMKDARAILVSLSVVDPDGARTFTIDDVEKLGELSGAALGRVFDASAKLSGITEADMDELAGN